MTTKPNNRRHNRRQRTVSPLDHLDQRQGDRRKPQPTPEEKLLATAFDITVDELLNKE